MNEWTNEFRTPDWVHLPLAGTVTLGKSGWFFFGGGRATVLIFIWQSIYTPTKGQMRLGMWKHLQNAQYCSNRRIIICLLCIEEKEDWQERDEQMEVGGQGTEEHHLIDQSSNEDHHIAACTEHELYSSTFWMYGPLICSITQGASTVIGASTLQLRKLRHTWVE